MLERNNGIVFRAENVRSESDYELFLTKGSIVNGCQTTMCLVLYAQKPCFVSVKVVETDNSWDVAKAANYQNSVAEIDLEIACHLRPQLAKRAASLIGVRLEGEMTSAFQVIDVIYQRKVAYDETRLLYIGLFSNSPNNLFTVNYTKLRQDVIDKFYKDDPYGDEIFDILFSIQEASQMGLREVQEVMTDPSYASIFDRFYSEKSPSYRCFVAILALCGAIRTDIAKRKDVAEDEYNRMKKFFLDTKEILDSRKEEFVRCYILAAKLWMQEIMRSFEEEAETRRDMHVRSRSMNFSGMYRKIRMEVDVDSRLRQGQL